MRILTYIVVGLLAAFIGYKASQVTTYNKKMKANIEPIIDQLKVELGDIQDKLSGSGLSEDENLKLEERKTKIFDILSTYYGYSVQQIKSIIK